MRDALRIAIRPLVDQLAEDLVEAIASHFDGCMADAIDVARSALASDFTKLLDGAARQHDVRTNGQAAGSRAQRRSEVESSAGVTTDSATRPPRTERSRSTRATSTSSKRNGSARSTRRLQPSGVSGATAGEGPAAVHFSSTEPAAIVAPTPRAERVPAPAPSLYSFQAPVITGPRRPTATEVANAKARLAARAMRTGQPVPTPRAPEPELEPLSTAPIELPIPRATFIF